MSNVPEFIKELEALLQKWERVDEGSAAEQQLEKRINDVVTENLTQEQLDLLIATHPPARAYVPVVPYCIYVADWLTLEVFKEEQ